MKERAVPEEERDRKKRGRIISKERCKERPAAQRSPHFFQTLFS